MTRQEAIQKILGWAAAVDDEWGDATNRGAETLKAGQALAALGVPAAELAEADKS